MSTRTGRRPVVMADARTVVAHLVTDDAVAAGRRAGRYRAVCGALVVPGSLKQAAEDYCRACARRIAGREGRRG